MIVRHVSELIGDTPLFEISPEITGLTNIDVYAKCELFNPFGSVKDKSAWQVLKDHLAEIKAGGLTVIESSSGNMAKAIQLITSINGTPFKIVTNRIKVREVKQILQLLGAEIDELPGLSECPDPTDPNDPVSFIDQIMSANPGKYFHTSQYTNEKNISAHYESTGKEILADLGAVDFFIGGLGTTGSTRGAGTCLKEANPDLKNIGVIASKGNLLPGIRDVDEMYEVGLFRKDFYDEIVEVDIDESLDAMLDLIRKCGILAGPTGGGSYAAALKYLRRVDGQIAGRKKAVFIVCDRVEWYLSYLQKVRPSLFGLASRSDSVRAVPKEDWASAPQVTVAEAGAWLAGKERALVVDMRGALAFKSSRIPGSINLPSDALEDLSDWGVPFSNGQRVLFVCPTGDQSRRFAAYYKGRGVDCASLEGGFVAWRDAGLPTERAEAGGRRLFAGVG